MSELFFDFIFDMSVVQSVKFIPSCFMYGQNEVESSIPKRVELGDHVAVPVRYVPLPYELSNLDERARDIAHVIL